MLIKCFLQNFLAKERGFKKEHMWLSFITFPPTFFTFSVMQHSAPLRQFISRLALRKRQPGFPRRCLGNGSYYRTSAWMSLGRPNLRQRQQRFNSGSNHRFMLPAALFLKKSDLGIFILMVLYRWL
jgi:hypothetical protein